MIQKESFLRVVDNSGVKYVKCLQVKSSASASVGDILVVSVKSLQKKLKFSSKIKKGDIYYAILVRTQNKLTRVDSQWLHFSDNAVILINKNFKPLANRVFGPVLKSLRQMKSFKVISISSGLV